MKIDLTWKEKLTIIRQSIDMIGLWLTLRYALIYLLAYSPRQDRSFDRKHRTDTSGRIDLNDLGITDKTARSQAVVYLPSPPRVTHYLLRCLDIDYRTFTFVDIGSGKGRVVLVASEFPFKKVIGVELSEKLHKIAQKNLSICKNLLRQSVAIDLYCGDARVFPLPECDTVFHLYHPFGQEVLRHVLQNIQQSVEDNPRRILILYLLPVETVQIVFEEFTFLRKVKEFYCINAAYNWDLYSN